jgi:hypothetical protein
VASEKALEAGGRAERHADKTSAYASFEEAVQYFGSIAESVGKSSGKSLSGVPLESEHLLVGSAMDSEPASPS